MIDYPRSGCAVDAGDAALEGAYLWADELDEVPVEVVLRDLASDRKRGGSEKKEGKKTKNKII